MAFDRIHGKPRGFIKEAGCAATVSPGLNERFEINCPQEIKEYLPSENLVIERCKVLQPGKTMVIENSNQLLLSTFLMYEAADLITSRQACSGFGELRQSTRRDLPHVGWECGFLCSKSHKAGPYFDNRNRGDLRAAIF